MNYVYPKLSEYDLGFIRLGGAGLGNILFAYARAAVYARDHELQMIWPTWPSLKIGPILRGEKDKRFYGDLFQKNKEDIGGLRKAYLRISCPKVKESQKESAALSTDTIIEFEGFENCFEEILYDYEWVANEIYSHLKEKNRVPLKDDFSDSVCVHIRLGDFARVSVEEVKNGRHDSSLPIDWYVAIIRQIREYVGRQIPVYIFSDGTDEELAPVLGLEGVSRKTYGTSIADIIGLAQAPLLVASGSSFSMWARYLGRHSCICYTNQIKQHILTPEENDFEYETDGVIEEKIGDRIRELYRHKTETVYGN